MNNQKYNRYTFMQKWILGLALVAVIAVYLNISGGIRTSYVVIFSVVFGAAVYGLNYALIYIFRKKLKNMEMNLSKPKYWGLYFGSLLLILILLTIPVAIRPTREIDPVYENIMNSVGEFCNQGWDSECCEGGICMIGYTTPEKKVGFYFPYYYEKVKDNYFSKTLVRDLNGTRSVISLTLVNYEFLGYSTVEDYINHEVKVKPEVGIELKSIEKRSFFDEEGYRILVSTDIEKLMEAAEVEGDYSGHKDYSVQYVFELDNNYLVTFTVTEDSEDFESRFGSLEPFLQAFAITDRVKP